MFLLYFLGSELPSSELAPGVFKHFEFSKSPKKQVVTKKDTFMKKTQRTEDFIRTEHGIRFVNHSMLGALIEVLGPFGFPGSSGLGQVYPVPLFYMGGYARVKHKFFPQN